MTPVIITNNTIEDTRNSRTFQARVLQARMFRAGATVSTLLCFTLLYIIVSLVSFTGLSRGFAQESRIWSRTMDSYPADSYPLETSTARSGSLAAIRTAQPTAQPEQQPVQHPLQPNTVEVSRPVEFTAANLSVNNPPDIPSNIPSNIPLSVPVPETPIVSASVSEPVGIQVMGDAVVFGETLDAAWTRAVALSRDLQAKGHQTDAARWNTRAARGLALPKISNTTAAVSMEDQPYFHSTIPGISPPGGIPMPVADEDFVASVTSVTVPLYLGGRVRGMIQSANALTAALASGEKIGEQDLKYQVTETYFLVLRVRRILTVAEEAAATLAKHEKDAKRLFENGLVTKNVVLAAGVARAEADQDVIKARNGVQLAEAAYNRLLWRPLTTPVAVMDEEVPPLSGDYETLAAQAISSRSELAALSSQSQALAAQRRVHRADVLPQVALVGIHSYWENEYVTPNSNFTGAVGMAWMPFDGGTSRSRQEAVDLEAMAIAKKCEEVRKSIELQVYQYWLAEQETRERLTVAELAVTQADENLRVVTRSFQQGLLNHTEVLDAQTLRTQAWNNFANTRYDAILATWQLRHALGRL